MHSVSSGLPCRYGWRCRYRTRPWGLIHTTATSLPVYHESKTPLPARALVPIRVSTTIVPPAASSASTVISTMAIAPTVKNAYPLGSAFRPYHDVVYHHHELCMARFRTVRALDCLPRELLSIVQIIDLKPRFFREFPGLFLVGNVESGDADNKHPVQCMCECRHAACKSICVYALSGVSKVGLILRWMSQQPRRGVLAMYTDCILHVRGVFGSLLQIGIRWTSSPNMSSLWAPRNSDRCVWVYFHMRHGLQELCAYCTQTQDFLDGKTVREEFAIDEFTLRRNPIVHWFLGSYTLCPFLPNMISNQKLDMWRLATDTSVLHTLSGIKIWTIQRCAYHY